MPAGAQQDVGYPPMPGLRQAVARMEAGYADAERRTREHAKRQRMAVAAPRIVKAAQALLDAFGGTPPDWLKGEVADLEDALAAIPNGA